MNPKDIKVGSIWKDKALGYRVIVEEVNKVTVRVKYIECSNMALIGRSLLYSTGGLSKYYEPVYEIEGFEV